jgi:hypothetical protein
MEIHQPNIALLRRLAENQNLQLEILLRLLLEEETKITSPKKMGE